MNEILLVSIPALLVLITAYVLLDMMFKNEAKRRFFEINKKNISIITPIRLRAYERLILVLERTTPNVLILSVSKPGMSNFDLHAQLLSSVRDEFSHNFSQRFEM